MFVRRPSLDDQICEQLCRSGDNTLVPQPTVVGIWGLGGSGKSQSTLNYLQRHRHEYDGVFWIQAGQTASINRDFLQIKRLLPRDARFRETEDANPAEVRQTVLDWLTRTPGKWLMVFDGADSIHPDDENFFDPRQFIPGCANVHVLITSRSTAVQNLSTFDGVHVGELDEDQAVDLFFQCSGASRTGEQAEADATAIIRELGHLALAIAIAGAYISQTPRLLNNLPAYLEEFKQDRENVLSEQPDEVTATYNKSLMTVWEASFSAVSNRLPEAGRLLMLLAFVHYENIFLGLFVKDPSSGISWRSILRVETDVSTRKLEKCFAILERYSLISRLTTGSYSIHRLVHAWSHDRLLKSPAEIDSFCLAALQVLYEAAERSSGPPVAKLQLMPHILANFEHTRLLQLNNEEDRIHNMKMMEYMIRFGSSIWLWKEVTAMARELLARRKQILGDEHLATISTMYDLAGALRAQGKPENATAMIREVLEKVERILGDKHPNTILALRELAWNLKAQGQLKDAEAIMCKVLEKRQQLLGDEHLDVISAMSDLAAILIDQRRYDEAAPMTKRVLEKRKQILGDNHLDTLTVMSNHAGLLAAQGQVEEAAGMQQQILTNWKQTFGDDHPNTIIAVANLATTLARQRHFEEAAVLQQDVLAKRKQIYGDQHLDTMAAAAELAWTLANQGHFEEAAVLQQDVLVKRKQIYGDDHPDTILALESLAKTLTRQGQSGKTVAMYRKILAKKKQRYGDDHPDTIMAMRNLANIYIMGDGNFQEAEAMMQEVVKKTKRVLGNEHVDTLSAAEELRAMTLFGRLFNSAMATSNIQ